MVLQILLPQHFDTIEQFIQKILAQKIHLGPVVFFRSFSFATISSDVDALAYTLPKSLEYNAHTNETNDTLLKFSYKIMG